MAFNKWTEKTRLDISSGAAAYVAITDGTPSITITSDLESRIRFSNAIGTACGNNSLKIPASTPVEIVVPWGVKNSTSQTIYLHVLPLSSAATKYCHVVEH